MRYYAKNLLATFAAFAASVAFTAPLSAQTSGDAAPEVGFCDPTLSREINRTYEDDDDAEFEERHRYDLERAQPITDPDAIANALLEELWNRQTGQLSPRYELCQSQPSYVVHWAQIFGRDDDDATVLNAEGLLRFQREGSFKYVYSDRSYRGTWTLEVPEMVLEAPWLDNGTPMRTRLELVQTPVEITYEDGRTDTYVEEHLRLGWFRLLRIATTERGAIRKCDCDAQ